MLGAEGGGFDVLRLVQRWGRALLLASWLGLMQAVVERAVGHVRSGREFGRPLGSLPATRSAIADIVIRTEVMRRMVYRAASEIDSGRGDGRSVSIR
ncbi:hypothetical protein KXS07_24965 [Inquilinus limosus]|uniref:acyl-CoA dehydrogenase family protein n=1 Tax=Inquilinus limosus TaxID=171674 RepID=UPI003F181150